VFPDLSRSARHELANSVTIYLCEGMALHRAQRMAKTPGHTSLTSDHEAMALDALKSFLRTSYSDVRPLETNSRHGSAQQSKNSQR